MIWVDICILQFCFWSDLIKWYILFEIFDGSMRIPDAWILKNWNFSVLAYIYTRTVII